MPRLTAIPGKLKIEDLNQLIDLVQGRCVLQLGCYCGRGTLVLARHARKTWVLEDFNHPHGLEEIVEELKVNVERHAPEDSIINLLYGTAEGWSVPEGGEDLSAEEVEVVYRDADRQQRREEQDQGLAMCLLKNGGIYAWHDANHDLRWLIVQPVPVEAN